MNEKTFLGWENYSLYNGQTFLAFSRGLNKVNDGRHGEVTIEAGIEYDVAAQIDQKNGWFEPSEISQEQMEMLIKVAARGLHELFHFCFAGRKLNQKGMQIAMRRFVAVAWLLHSEMLIGVEKNPTGTPIPLTLEQLGNVPQLDCSRCALSLLAKKFGEQFQFHTRVQKRQGSKENYAKSAKTGWVKRRARAKAKNAVRMRQQTIRRNKLKEGCVPNDGYSGKCKKHHFNP